MTKVKFCLIVCFLFLSPFSAILRNGFSEEFSQSDLSIFKDILSATNSRQKAMERLLVAPTEEVYSTALEILRNPKETLAMKHVVESGLIAKHDSFVMREIQTIAFSRTADDDITRQICLSILWKSSILQEQEALSSELLHIAKNTHESDDLRRISIGFLANSKITFSKDANWAEQIAINKRDSNAARTAAMNYMEYTGSDSLNLTIAKIIKDSRDNEQIRTITILRAARLQMSDLTLLLEAVLMDQKDSFELRKTCLNMLLYYGFSTDAKIILGQLLLKEKDEKMRGLIKNSIEELKNQPLN